MNKEYIQNLRYKFQKRVRRVNSTEYQIFHYVLKQFWGFLQKQPLLVGIMDQLRIHVPKIESEVDKLFNSHAAVAFDDELDNAAACYLVLKRCVESNDSQIEINVAHCYSRETKFNDILEFFKDVFVEPFYDYLDENLDDKGFMLSVLRHYKHKCEWFQGKNLYDKWSADTGRGEKILALHLYEYFHDQGIEFSIEPTSISGEADLVSSQKGSEEPIIADAKIFNPAKSKGKDYIAKAFRQIYSYTLDYNEPVGFLVIFKTCKEDLKFALKDVAQGTSFLQHNGKTIFFVVIDIYPYEHPASKRGTLDYVELSETDLARELNNHSATESVKDSHAAQD